ncbi:glycosyltransferase family 2 protein [Candidatus Aenigmatarchaeota archaeon]
MSKNKLVSVIIPNYNTREDYLDEAISSVAGQIGIPLGDIELVIVDDHSSPEGKRILERSIERSRYVKPELEIKLGSNKYGKGIGTARNTGIFNMSDADYIGILDSDDGLVPTTIGKTVETAERNKDCSLVFTDHIKSNGKLTNHLYIRDKSEFFRLHQLYKNTLNDPHLHLNMVGHFQLFRREALEAVGGYRDLPPCEDFDITLRMSHMNSDVNFMHVPEPLYIHRHNPGSVGNNKRKKSIAGVENILLSVLRELKYPITDVKYLNRLYETRSSFFNLLLGGNVIDVPWLDRMNCSIHEPSIEGTENEVAISLPVSHQL